MDFEKASKKAFSAMLKEYGIRESMLHYPKYEEVNNRVWKLFEEKKINAETLRGKRFDDFFYHAKIKGIDPFEANASYLNHLVEFTTMLEGSRELLDRIAGKAKMAIITNGLKEVQRPRLKRLGVKDYFDVIVVSDEIGVAKPDAGFFDHAFNESNHPDKNQVLVVGDGLNSDIRGGINYGVDTCWARLFKQKDYANLKYTYSITRLDQLDEIIG